MHPDLRSSHQRPATGTQQTGPARLALAGALVAAATLLMAAPSAGAGAPADAVRGNAAVTRSPLTVRLTTLSPSTIPRKGSVRMRGTVRNDSHEVWQGVNVHAFVSTTPITSPAELTSAARTPYDQDVGTRLVTSNAFVGVGDLDPGETATFALRIPRSELPIPELPGVYWVGVHALGADETGRDELADGRARTFMPLYRAKRPKASVELVVPFRARVRRDGTGALRDPSRWAALIGHDGRLGRLVDLARTGSGAQPLTLLVDPAVLDAVDTLRTGPTDPSVGPALSASTASPSASESPKNTPSAPPSPSGSADNDGSAAHGPTAARAKGWLDRFSTLARDQDVLGTGYADPDIAALAEYDPQLLDSAYALGQATFRSYRIRATPVAAPVDGYLPGSALAYLGTTTQVLLTDHGTGVRRAGWGSAQGQSLVFGDSDTASGGPGPGSRTDALSLRQRIVSAAALRGQTGSVSPLVVVLPSSWDPGSRWRSAHFFAGLDLPWLRVVRSAPDASAPVWRNLPFPAAARAAVLPSDLVTAARAVVAQSRVYADALTRSTGVVDGLTRLALQTTSYHAREDPTDARIGAMDVRRAIGDRLTGIRVVGQPLVAMSAGSGIFVVTLVNDLDKPVRIGIRASTDTSGLTIRTPASVVLPPHKRTTVPLRARATQAGVRQVTLSPVTDQGDKVGTPITLTVRSNQVGTLIWAIMAAGGALLFVMIVRRWVKRGLSRRSPAA